MPLKSGYFKRKKASLFRKTRVVFHLFDQPGYFLALMGKDQKPLITIQLPEKRVRHNVIPEVFRGGFHVIDLPAPLPGKVPDHGLEVHVLIDRTWLHLLVEPVRNSGWDLFVGPFDLYPFAAIRRLFH